ncbi:hypothetical protein ACFLQI_01855 [Candidatus Undinarchaeota archaeon]
MKKKIIYKVESQDMALEIETKIKKFHDRIASNLKYEIDNHGTADWLVTIELDEDYAARFKEFIGEEDDSVKLDVPLGDKDMYLRMKGAADGEKKRKAVEKKVKDRLSLRIIDLIRKKGKSGKD